MSSKKRRTLPEEGLNLVPIMNLVTILIPFLLMSAQFVALAVIDSTLPAITTEIPSVPPGDEDVLELSVLITAEGFTFAGKGVDKVLEKDDEVSGAKVPCLDAGCQTPDSYNYRALTERCGKLKDRFDDAINVILVPESRIPYEVIVLTMDATRDDQEDKDDDNVARVLFPNVVIAGGVE